MSWGPARRPKISNKLGIPTSKEGSDGDTQIRQTNLGAKLYGKIGGRWYSTFLSKEEEIIGTSGTKIGMTSDGALTVDQINLTGKISLKSSGTENVCIGIDNADIGNANVFIGVSAGENAVTGMSDNVAVGRYAMQSTATGSSAASNVAIGTLALARMDGTGSALDNENYNIAIGHSAGGYMDEGTRNVMIGHQAMHCATSGNPYGTANIAIGYRSMYVAESTIGNVIIGTEAGKVIDEGDYNTCVGHQAGNAITTGNKNVMIGYDCDTSNATAEMQIAIGYNVVTSDESAIAIGNGITAAAEVVTIGVPNDYIYCDFGEDEIWHHSSDRRSKKDIIDNTLGLCFINDLKTVTFKRKPPSELPEEFEGYDAEKTERRKPDKVYYGFIAQDVKEAMDKAGIDKFPAWKVSEDGSQSLGKAAFITPLVKAVQELSAKIDTMQTEINNLKAE